ncbi:MAG: hypothetical protein D6681_04915 [Calditrichaeota bacterium]|nr:MAG: hypothetical protein D6681_04915 [Calditrichota bacterium]
MFHRGPGWPGIALLLGWTLFGNGQSLRFVELSPGDAYCLPAPLIIRQTGHPDISLTARYRTESFKTPFYYALRLSFWQNRRGWEVELLHLKLFLTHKPEEIQRFSISHGFNLLTLLRGWKINRFLIRVGVGVVIAHPENTVRNQKLPENRGIFRAGYYLSGVALHAGVGRRFVLNRRLHLNVEGRITAAGASVPVIQGSATVWHVGMHLLMGLGYRL